MDSNPPLTMREVAEAIFLDDSERNKLLRFAHAKFGIQAGDAEDIAQETAFDLLRQRGYVRSPKAFVRTVFRARCCRFIEKRKHWREVFAEDTSNAEEGGSPAKAESLDRQIALRQALTTISPACLRLLAAYYVEGESLREVAKRLSLAYASMSKTISRCLKKLRQCLR